MRISQTKPSSNGSWQPPPELLQIFEAARARFHQLGKPVLSDPRTEKQLFGDHADALRTSGFLPMSSGIRNYLHRQPDGAPTKAKSAITRSSAATAAPQDKPDDQHQNGKARPAPEQAAGTAKRGLQDLLSRRAE
jgi:hypothetical protein